MPLLGHAFVGIATAVSVGPFPSSRPPGPLGQRRAAHLWMPAVVVLAYLPDLVTQLGLLAGLAPARAVGHSALVALALAAAVAAVAATIGQVSPARLFAVTLGSALLHDLLDVAQSTDRMPWWPLSARALELPAIIPEDARHETILFAALFAAFLLVRAAWRRGRAATAPPVAAPSRLATVLVVSMVALAAGTHYLRDVREQQLESARGLLEQGRFAEARARLEAAERWPATAKPGRILHLRGEAWRGLGDPRRAERDYLASYEADPHFFWLVADLAMLYASADGQPAAERRRRVEPYLARLRQEFAAEPARAAILARIERALARPRRHARAHRRPSAAISS
jgi:hypothetical protein